MTATTATEPPSYPHCRDGADAEDPVGCRGHRVPRPQPDDNEAEADLYDACLAHLDESERGIYLASLRPGSHVDHRGTAFDAVLLGRLLDAVCDTDGQRPRLGTVSLQEATFQGVAGFGATTFEGKAAFDGATFEGIAVFNHATFQDVGHFSGATFRSEVQSHGATFQGSARFDGVTFQGDAWFDRATFQGDGDFSGATFQGSTQFEGVAFQRFAHFRRTTFEKSSHLGPFACWQTVQLTSALFAEAVTLEIAAGNVDCERTRWASTAVLRLRHAEIDLSDTLLEFPLSVTAHPPFIVYGYDYLNEGDLPATTERTAQVHGEFASHLHAVLVEGRDVPAPVRVASLRGVDASHLVLTDVDLSGCRFAGAIHLDQLRLHGRCNFRIQRPSRSFSVWGLLPGLGGRRVLNGLRRGGLLPLRFTSRQILAEERDWRIDHSGIRAGVSQNPAENRAPLEPAALAPIYRELRKGFEDAKNEPGAADFYYGEMEMRRHDAHGPLGERVLLWLYWAISGYGLRASRALGWLLAAMTATVLLMIGSGLPDTPAQPYPPGAGVIGKQNPQLHADFTDRFTAARAHKAADVVINSVVFRSSGQQLTTVGRYTEMAARFTEPVLLGLALLAVRSRVKR